MRLVAIAILGLSSCLWAQGPADPCATAPASCATLIETHATSETRVANSAADVSVRVTATGKDMAEVQRTLATNSSTLLAFLKAQKVDRLMTSGVSFTPETQPQKNAPDKTVGYQGIASVTLRTTPDKLGDILSGVLSNGANEIESTTFTPTEQELAEARTLISEEATRTAVAQAEGIARAAGEHVVSIRTINVNEMFAPQPMPMVRMGAVAKAASIPMETSAGEQRVSVTVSVTAAAMK